MEEREEITERTRILKGEAPWPRPLSGEGKAVHGFNGIGGERKLRPKKDRDSIENPRKASSARGDLHHFGGRRGVGGGRSVVEPGLTWFLL